MEELLDMLWRRSKALCARFSGGQVALVVLHLVQENVARLVAGGRLAWSPRRGR